MDTPITTFEELVERVSSRAGASAETTRAVLEALGSALDDSLRLHQRVQLPGFGFFRLIVKEGTPARAGINPITKQPMTISAKPAQALVRARPDPALLDRAEEWRAAGSIGPLFPLPGDDEVVVE